MHISFSQSVSVRWFHGVVLGFVNTSLSFFSLLSVLSEKQIKT